MKFLILAILSSTIISIIMRISDKYVKNNMSMFASNYLICTILALFFKGNMHIPWGADGLLFAVLCGAVTGILYLVNFILLQWNIQKNGVVLAGTFMKLGVVVPIAIALLMFHEIPSITQILGCLIAIIAIIMVQFEKNTSELGQHKIWLIFLLLISGITDSLSNIFDKMGNTKWKEEYLILIFVTALISSILMKIIKKQSIHLFDVIFGALIGIPNYFAARFLLLSLGSVPAIIVYPMYSVMTIVCITLSGMVIFKEHITKQKRIAIGLIIIALVCINI